MAKSNMDQDILKVLYSEEQLKTRVQEMGDELYERLKGKNPLFLGVLKGSFIFMADIVRACQLKSDIEFIAVSSYQNATTSSGVVQITRDLQQDITGRDIVVIEDILDSGNALLPQELLYDQGRFQRDRRDAARQARPPHQAHRRRPRRLRSARRIRRRLRPRLRPEVPQYAVHRRAQAGGLF